MAALAEIGFAAGLAQTLFSAIQTNKEVRAMCSMFKYESQLQQLEETLCTIKALLLDVEHKRQGLTHEGQLWVEKLKDAVYDIDDLLDEFAASVGHQQHWDSNKFSEKVCGFISCFFSRYNKCFVAFNVSREIKMLREKLDAITKDHHDVGNKVVSNRVERRSETWSYISDREVIGREDDKEAIVKMLLPDVSHSSKKNFSFVSIVGMGGLGKTALAQLVYNDKRVEQELSERIWVCVSEVFGLKQILVKILGNKEATLQQMQRQVRTLLECKKYLLVLDDVWNESPEEWLTLKSSLLDMVSNVSGSKIIVTSRSRQVAASIGEKDQNVYELEGLSEGDSCKLFKRLAFGESEVEVDLELVKDIVKKCANVPFSIRVVASLLYKQDKNKWLMFRSIDLAKMCRDENSIMPTLMFSYYELPAQLKCCFSFCSLFPKDYEILKEVLINMWLAQGFLAQTENAEESMDDVGERYFTILLNRCFFQDMKLDPHGNVYSFKMHDLMHDLAVQVAGKETFILTPSGPKILRNKIRHLSAHYGSPNMCLSNTLRTYVGLKNYAGGCRLDVTPVISKCKRLRVLSLEDFISPIIPDKVGKLLHLRYLDLSRNYELVMLPQSITKLYNLQTLKLRSCRNLKKLPEDVSTLVNLRTLDIHDCTRLNYMPRGMNNLKNLHTLTEFVVGGDDLNQVQGGKLVDLQGRSLKGDLRIRVQNFSLQHRPLATERAFILKDACLKKLVIIFSNLCCDENQDHVSVRIDECDQSEVHETLIENLCPNEDIISFSMVGYKGSKLLPSWASMMVSDDGLQHVKSLSRFGNLKVVKLKQLAEVEYIGIAGKSAATLVSMTFFPFLEKLKLIEMPKLKGWWTGITWREREGKGGCLVDGDGSSIHLPYFPRLHDLKIKHCQSMTYFPPCPHLKVLHLVKVNKALTFCCIRGDALSSDTPASSLCLKKLEIDDARVMNSVLRAFVGGVVDITLRDDKETKGIGILKEGFERLGRVLRKLEIANCWKLDMEDEDEEGVPFKYLQSLSLLELTNLPKMVKLPVGIQYLESLQSLDISTCRNLEEVEACIGFKKSLQSLKLTSCHNLKALPRDIGSLTSLQYLKIDSCGLKSFPESICHLNSLTTLDVWTTSKELWGRCREGGDDWPNICRIPNFNLSYPDDLESKPEKEYPLLDLHQLEPSPGRDDLGCWNQQDQVLLDYPETNNMLNYLTDITKVQH